jgi:preprotein translocase subunit SecA
VNDASADMTAALIEEFNRSQRHDAAAAVKNLTEQLRATFGYQPALGADETKNPEALEKRIAADLEKDIAGKAELIGQDNLNAFIRDNYLHAIDRKWLDHLENMEALREAVYLRSYAQKNPLTEYKVEGFQIFDRMIDEIRQEIASRLHLIRIQTADGSGGQTRRPVSRSSVTAQSASHGSVSAFGGAARQGGAMQAASRPDGATVVRSQPKVGRNDPCPCGSGKKYKFCHGRS